MLRFDEDSQNSKILAVHYAHQIGEEFLLSFMSGKADILSREQALLVIQGFWKMTDLAIQDNHEDRKIEGITDIEFWMHKLFIKVNGYMMKCGFKDIWDASVHQR